jgi:hypothetical protein
MCAHQKMTQGVQRESCPGPFKRPAHATRTGRSLLAHGEVYPELRTTLEFNQGYPAAQRAALAALCPFLAGNRATAKFAGGSVEPTAGSAVRPPPLFSPSRLTPEERLQVLVCVGHPSSVIKDLTHAGHLLKRTLSVYMCISPFSVPIPDHAGTDIRRATTRIMPFIRHPKHFS